MEYKTLSNGVEMPMLGYGVFQIDDETTERCVADAIASGYRMIDTAQAYGNERGVGAGIKAIGAAHGRSVGQVALRYLLDLGVIAIPKTTRRERMEENLDVFDFELSDEDRARIAELDLDRSLCYDHKDVQLIGGLLNLVKGQIAAQA